MRVNFVSISIGVVLFSFSRIYTNNAKRILFACVFKCMCIHSDRVSNVHAQLIIVLKGLYNLY